MKHLKNYISILSMLLAMFLLTFASCTKEKSNTENVAENESENGYEYVAHDLSGYNGPEYVDLGLPSGLKWATCNVGANSPEEYGDYFAWGETEPKEDYSWSTYKYCNGDRYSLTKYCTDPYYGPVDNKTTLELKDDVARVNLGGKWRMPTAEEIDELIDKNNCTWTWTERRGVNGYKVTSKKNGNSIFLPAAGCRFYDELYDAGGNGYYWSSSLISYDSSLAYYLGFDSSDVGRGSSARCFRRSVRAVCE